MGNEASSALGEPLPPDSLFDPAASDVDESILFTESETFVYRIGARASALGHTAASWGLDEPQLTGLLRVTAFSGLICVAIWRKAASTPPTPAASAAQQRYPLTLQPLSSGHALVALCRIPLARGARPAHAYMEPVLDSSRYFVLRCVPPPGRAGAAAATPAAAEEAAVFLGFGFRHREAAFQLKACITDYTRQVERQAAGPPQQQAPAAAQGAARVGGEGEDDSDGFGALVSAPPPPKITLASKSIPLLRPPPPPPSAAALSPPQPPGAGE